MKTIKLYEDFNKSYVMYSGITKNAWLNIWKDKNLTDKLTNVTSDYEFASDYSYDFNTGKYEDNVVVIKNIPLEAFVAYRYDDYSDDDDFNSMKELSDLEKKEILNNYNLFLVDLLPFKNEIETKLI
jgi:hypothetical protein